MPRGKLIVFEGLDRSGKSTQVQLLADALRKEGMQVQCLRFPDRTTPIGRMIGDYLSGGAEYELEDHVIHLLFSANRWELSSTIRTTINSGTTLIVDRYYYSGCVYSAAKQNPALSLAWARRPEEGLPRPDVCVFLDIDPEAAAKRGGYGEERYEKEDMQRKVRGLFGGLMERAEGEDLVRVDAARSVEEVAGVVLGVVRGVVERVDREGGDLRVVGGW
ncbi:thymidylate kinase [Sporormia fimetaria CBS 119925]|uniref:Thymidylate kinase n=1 Tax=Sporormia fimetaria CBS 119925 TaxID=1340428 RepID=A0A6A6V189_9PLEO|nr:thymidylate kinase [Sporormia fimetaria CBS 119925]